MSPQLKLNLGSRAAYERRELPALPSLDGVTELGFDTETDRDLVLTRKLYSFSWYTPDGRSGFVSVRHPDSVNYDEEVVRRWLKAELAGKRLIGAGVKHEDHVLRTFGVELSELRCELYDVFHAGALLNERRWQTNLEALAREEFGTGKVDLGNTDTYPIHERPAEEVADYAVEDARLAISLKQAYEPRIKAEGLERVLQLENDLVYSTVEMERNGSPINVDLLVKWDGEVQQEYEARVMKIYHQTKMAINPMTDDVGRLLRYCGIEHTGYSTEKGRESYAEEALLSWAETNELIRWCLEARQLASYRAKYTQAYLRNVHADGRIFYALHQLRAESEGAMAGTVVGRYSSSALDKKTPGGGINVQQVAKTAKMPRILQQWPIRQLFIPPKGEKWFSSDASQLQFRELAHYAAKLGRTRLAQRYRENPNIDFHNLVMEWTGLNRDFTKNVNYAKLFGGGPSKVAFMCHKTEAEAKKIIKDYDREFPEASFLMRQVENTVKTRGYVKTILGRRMRYDVNGDPKVERFYGALAKLLQGTEGDLVKLKILRLWNNRKALSLTLRSQVHDEVNKTAPVHCVHEIRNAMQAQEHELEVPITWETGSGPSWEEAK